MRKPTSGRLAGSPQPAGRRPHNRRRAALPQLSGHRWLRAVAVAAGLLIMAACGKAASTDAANTVPGGTSSPSITGSAPTSTPPPGSGAPTSAGPTSDAGTPPKASGPTVPPNQVTYVAPEAVPDTVWQQDDGKTLVVMAEEGGCSKVDAQVTKQTADEVDITLLTVATTQKICPQYIRNVPVAAHLDAPLGTRKVVLALKTGVQR
jgi:hypothetical protein